MMKKVKEGFKTILVRDKTHDRLRHLGISGESLDTIITRCIECYEKKRVVV